MLDAIRFDLEPRGILVTNVTPGFVRTPLTDRNKYRMPFLMEVGRAAEILADGLERPLLAREAEAVGHGQQVRFAGPIFHRIDVDALPKPRRNPVHRHHPPMSSRSRASIR